MLRILAGQNTRKKQFQFLRQLKLSLYEAIQVHALQYLQSRVSSQLLPGGVSWAWLTHLAAVPKLAVNGVARFAVLRWAVNEDDVECLRLRLAGSLQAEQPCQLCGVPTRLYPLGLNFAPLVKNAVMTMVSTPLPCTAVRDGDPDHVPLACHRGVGSGILFHFLPHGVTGHRDLPPCVACGYGDNSSQHWARFCIVPVLVANLFSPTPTPVKSLDQLARVNTAGCVIASHILHQFRRLLLSMEACNMHHPQFP